MNVNCVKAFFTFSSGYTATSRQPPHRRRPLQRELLRANGSYPLRARHPANRKESPCLSVIFPLLSGLRWDRRGSCLLIASEGTLVERFKIGDPVLILPRYAHLYPSDSGIVVAVIPDPFRPAFNEYTVEFADGATTHLFEFQIREVPE